MKNAIADRPLLLSVRRRSHPCGCHEPPLATRGEMSRSPRQRRPFNTRKPRALFRVCSASLSFSLSLPLLKRRLYYECLGRSFRLVGSFLSTVPTGRAQFLRYPPLYLGPLPDSPDDFRVCEGRFSLRRLGPEYGLSLDDRPRRSLPPASLRNASLCTRDRGSFDRTARLGFRSWQLCTLCPRCPQ